MSFKIVRTVESGNPQLCIVPSQWENGGILKWPKKGVERLAKDQNSIPKPEWSQINCLVKRRHLVSYEAADAELQTMLDDTDTEEEDDPVTFRHLVQCREPVNLNTLAENLARVINEDCGKSSRAVINCGNAFEVQSDQKFNIVPDNLESQSPTVSGLNTDIQNILKNQSIMFNITDHILENQKKIMRKLASLSTQMEQSSSKINSQPVVCWNEVPNSENDSFVLKQIKNIHNLDEMEQLLFDQERKMKLIKSCSIICSGGKGSGTNCAYRFLDVLFSRNFLCECSWSGSSRKDGVKISLKCYKNTLNFFFETVHQWDTTYTYEDNENFFKSVLKNAAKRSTAKFKRISTKRHRLKGLKSTKKQETIDAANMILVDIVEEATNRPNNEYYINECSTSYKDQ